jgi:hypothetical protein
MTCRNMTGGKRFAAACALCLVAAVGFWQTASAGAGGAGGAGGAAQRGDPRYVTGTVVGVGGRFGGRTLPFRLIIDRYTSGEEVARLNSALQSGGQEELLRELSRMTAGRIQIGNNVGVPANAIIETQLTEGGTRLTVLYERRINFFELRYGTRSENYRFGYAEMYLGRRGGNQGTFIPAAKVRLRDGNTWEVEDFGVFPARLMGLQARGTRNPVR